MDFDLFDKKMRVFEESLDQTIVPETYMVARIDGRSFTKLTKVKCDFEAPFDVRFRDMMVETLKHLHPLLPQQQLQLLQLQLPI